MFRDDKPTGKSIYSAVVKRISQIIPKPRNILDLGCGRGRIAKLLSDAGYDITACDIDPTLFPYREIKFLKMDLNKPLSIQNKYDLIVCTEVIEHVDNPKKILLDAYNILKPGGRLIITSPNNQNLLSRIYFLLTGKFPMFKGGKNNIGHIHPMFNWLIEFISKDLFEIENVTYNRGLIPLFNLEIPFKNKYFGQITIFTLKKIK